MKNKCKLWSCYLLMTWQLSAQSLSLTTSLPPFAPFYVDANKDCRGVGVKILDLITRQTGVHFEIESYPYARILKALKSGQLDAALIFKNRILRDDVYYVGPVTTSRILVVSLGGAQSKSYLDLKQLQGIAVIRKAQYQVDFDQDRELNKIYVESYQQGLKMLKVGLVEAIIGSELGLSYAMKQLAINPSILKQAYHLGNKETWLHLSKTDNHRALISILQQGVDRMYRFNLTIDVYRQQVEQGCYQ